MARRTFRTATEAERTTVHAIGGNLRVGNAVYGGEWNYSIGISGDLSCRVHASPIKKFPNPSKNDIVLISFYSMAEMRDNLEAALAKKRLPKAITAALLAAIPDFIIDAEAAYQTGLYYSRPS